MLRKTAQRSPSAGNSDGSATAAAALSPRILANPQAPAASLEIAELARMFDDALRRTLASVEACEAAEARLTRPAIPEALFRQINEPLHGYVDPSRGPGNRLWYGDDKHIKLLREWMMTSPGWEGRRARRDEILGAYDGWNDSMKAANDAAGVTAADAEYVAAWEEQEKPIRQRIVDLRSTEPAALRLKVRAYVTAVAALDWHADFEEKIAKAIDTDNGPWEDAAGLSILRDIVEAYVEDGA